MIREVPLPSGDVVPALGQGTWMMAERNSEQDSKALRLGIELGMTLIDTAEMYGEGRVEEMLSTALAGLRDRVFLVSKLYPKNAGRKGVVQACERSLKRLKTDRLDLYLLHWRGNIALSETVAGFEDLLQAGKIHHWGVSNFDTDDMRELLSLRGGRACATNQILYNLTRRACEHDLIPLLAEHRIPVMAYSPFEQGRLPSGGALEKVADRYHAQPYQIALAWLLQKPGVIAIPKSGKEAHVRANRAAADITLESEDVALLEQAFRPPRRKQPLDML